MLQPQAIAFKIILKLNLRSDNIHQTNTHKILDIKHLIKTYH